MTDPTHPLAMHPETKRWGNNHHRMLTPRDTRPASPCPICFLPGHTPDTGSLLQWRCSNKHEWCSTRQQAEAHATWVNRYFTGLDRNT